MLGIRVLKPLPVVVNINGLRNVGISGGVHEAKAEKGNVENISEDNGWPALLIGLRV
jgi:hypothetical protein